MVVGAKVCELTHGFLWFVCGLYVGILTSPLKYIQNDISKTNKCIHCMIRILGIAPCII